MRAEVPALAMEEVAPQVRGTKECDMHSRLRPGGRAPFAVLAGNCAQKEWCCRLRCCALGLVMCCFATWLQFRGRESLRHHNGQC